MATQHNAAAVPRRDARIGGALDAETRQQAAEVNRCVIDALGELFAADPRVARLAGGGAAARRGRQPQGIAGLQPPAARGPASAPPVRSTPHAAAGSPQAGGIAPSWPRPAGEAGGLLGGALLEVAPAWLALDDAARVVLAACPYLLVELDVPRLLASAVAARRVSDDGAVAMQRVAAATSSPAGPEAAGAAAAAAAAAAARGPASWPAPWCDVARMVFQFAWHLARVSPVLSGFVLGMRARDVDALRGIGLSQADALVPRVAPFVALRWRNDAALWSQWLAAARAGDRAGLRACELRGLQRLAGACRGAAAAPTP